MSGPKPSESSWIPFWTSRSNVSYRPLQPAKSSYGEKITSISSGLDHVLLLSSTGRLFTAASSSTSFPSHGQLGVPGLAWTTRPEGPYDQLHELLTLRGFCIKGIATGDRHSLVLDEDGRVFSFGDNSSGQLGFDPSSESPFVDAPCLLPTQALYASTKLNPHVTSVAAGGNTSFFNIDASPRSNPYETVQRASRVTADTWASGQGLLGTLGTGRWTHIQGPPVKIKALSSLFEFSEETNSVVPIRLKRLSVGATHASATLDNITYVSAGTSSSSDTPHDTNWGADVLWWGGNEFWQLGSGKRSNENKPVYIGPLDAREGDEKRKRGREGEKRLHITPWQKVKVGGRWVGMEQRVECGRLVSAVYSGV